MLLDELFEAEQLNELRPYSIASQAKDSIVSKAKGVFGGGQAEEGNMQAGEYANELFKQLKRYVGKTMGTNVKLIPYETLYKFLSGTKIGTEQLDSVKRVQYTPKEAAAIIFAGARAMQDEFASIQSPQEPVGQPQQQPKPQQSKPTGRVEPTFGSTETPKAQGKQSQPSSSAANDEPGSVDNFEPIISKLTQPELQQLLSII